MIEINHLSLNYGKRWIFNDVNYTFKNNGMYVVLGKSGSGKTTLIQLINQKVTPQEGRIIIDKDIKIGNIFQDIRLIPYYTVLDYLMLISYRLGLSKEKRMIKIQSLLKQFQLRIDLHSFINQLSGGEQQRIAIIGALLQDCNVLLCDEPTAYLDSENAKIVFEMLKKISENRLVIVTTHNQRNAQIYNDVLIEIKNETLYELKNKSTLKNRLMQSYDVPRIKLFFIMKISFVNFIRLRGLYWFKIFCITFMIISFPMLLILNQQSKAISYTQINDFNGYDTLIFHNEVKETQTYSISDILKICQLNENIIGYRFDLDKDWPFGLGVNDPNIKVIENDGHSWWYYPISPYVWFCEDGFNNNMDYDKAKCQVYEVDNLSHYELLCGDVKFKKKNDIVLPASIADYLLKRYHFQRYEELLNKNVTFYALGNSKNSGEGTSFKINLNVIGIINYHNNKYKKVFMGINNYSSILSEIFEFKTPNMKWYNVEFMIDSSKDTIAILDQLNQDIKEMYPHASFSFNDEIIEISSIDLFSDTSILLGYGFIVCLLVISVLIFIYLYI